MSNGQTLERQLITEFMREVLTYLRHRPGVALESLTHSTPERSFDLGKARKNQVIHNRAGDRIFITNLTGVAYIRFNSATASKYKLRVPGISTPFQKLYLENEAQPGKSVSIIIGYGGFVDFAATDFATQATLALIKAKTDLLTKLDVNLSTVAKESGGNLAALAALDFAEQTTLALIKAKTDLLTKLDVNLSTVAKESGGNLAAIKAKTDNLDVALSTKAKEAGGNLAALVAKDFATQTSLALIKTKIDNTFTEVQKLSTPVSIHDTSTGAALSVSLEVGHRRFIEVWVKTSAAATFKVYDSRDNVNWREADEIPLDGAGEIKTGYWNSSKYVKVSITDANDNEIEIAAS